MEETLGNKILQELGRITITINEMKEDINEMKDDIKNFKEENQKEHKAIMSELVQLISMVDKKHEARIVALEKSNCTRKVK